MSCDILSLLSPKQSFANAIAKQDSLWRLLWVLERPEENEKATTSKSVQITDRLQRGWTLLESLSASPSIATKLVRSSGWLELLGIMAGYETFTKRFESRLGAAKTLSRLLWDTNTGPFADPLLQRFLPPALVVVLKEEGPDVMLKLFDQDSETPELIWNGTMRNQLRGALAEQLDSFVKGRVEPDADMPEFLLSQGAGAKYKNLEGELYIGGVYVRLFLKEPTFNLRDPTSFLEKLMIRWSHELDMITETVGRGRDHEPTSGKGAIMEAQQDTLQLVTSASVYLCKVRDSLCDKLAQWGYMAQSVSKMREVLACELIGTPLLSIMRILHVASNRLVNVEALAISGGSDGTSGVVKYTIDAIGGEPLHKDSAFMVDVLLKIYKKALGDVKKASKGMSTSALENSATAIPQLVQGAAAQQYSSGPTDSAAFHAMAPSPAPGLEPVRKTAGKAKIEHPLDHPLAFGGGPEVSSNYQAAAAQSGVRSSGSYRQPAQPASTASQSSGYSMQSSGSVNALSYRSQSNSGNNAHREHPLASPLPAGNHPINHPLSHPAGHIASSDRHTYSPEQHYPSTQVAASLRYGSVNPRSSLNHGQQKQDAAQYGSSPHFPSGSMSVPAGRPTTNSYSGTNAPSGTRSDPSQEYGRVAVPLPQPSVNASSRQSEQNISSLHNQIAPSPVTQSPAPSASYSARGMMSGAYADSRPLQSPLPPAPSGAGSLQGAGDPLSTMQYASFSPQQHQTQFGNPPYRAAMQSSFGTPEPVQSRQPESFMQGFAAAQGIGSPEGLTAPNNVQYGSATATEHLFPSAQGAGAPAGMMPPTNVQYGSTPFAGASPGTSNAQYGYNQVPGAQSGMSAPINEQYGSAQGVGAPAAMSVPSNVQYESAQGASAPAGTLAGTLAAAPAPATQYRPTPIEGSGIDARSTITPKQAAEQQMLCTAGAPGSAQGRIALLQSALACKLCKFLVEGVLENPGLSSIKDPAAAKVHSVELLKLLTMDPGYGLKFKLILDDMPAWKKYKSQDHSLFITGAEQKADYFLTDGDKEATKLLTEK